MSTPQRPEKTRVEFSEKVLAKSSALETDVAAWVESRPRRDVKDIEVKLLMFSAGCQTSMEKK